MPAPAAVIPAYRPLEVEPGRGDWQRDRLRTALARLTLAPGPHPARAARLRRRPGCRARSW